MDPARLADIDDPAALARALPDGEPSDPWPLVRDILDDARAGLPDAEFDLVVSGTRRPSEHVDLASSFRPSCICTRAKCR